MRKLLGFVLGLAGFSFPMQDPGTLAAPPPSRNAARGVTYNDITRASGLASFRHTGGSPTKPYLPDFNGSGVALFDYDNDGWLDIYLVNAQSHDSRTGKVPPLRSALFHNNHDGTFTDVTEKAGVENVRWGTGVCAGDFDNDGWEDLFVANLGKSRLYRNNGNGTFTDIAAEAGVQVDTWATGCAFGDYDSDGLLDLYVATYVDFDWNHPPPSGDWVESGKETAAGRNRTKNSAIAAAYDPSQAYCTYFGVRVACGPMGLKPAPDFLFHNNGNRTFRDVTRESGVGDAPARYGLGVGWVDVDDDGRPDIVVANDSQPNYLFANLGNGRFEEIGRLSGIGTNRNGEPQAYMGMAVGDFRHSGRDDFLVTTFATDNFTFFRNNGQFDFTDASIQAGLAEVTLPFLGWGTAALDYDNDGWLDIVVVNGHVFPQANPATWKTSYLQRTLLFRNLQGGRFEDVSGNLGPGFTTPKSSRGAAVGDLFNEGAPDIVINNLDSTPTLLRNRGGSRAGHWIMLTLVGNPARRSPRDAIGAVVFCTAGGVRQRGEVASGRGYVSQNDPRVHFGLGATEKIDRLEVRWPNGEREAFTPPGVDRFIRIEQGRGVRQP